MKLFKVFLKQKNGTLQTVVGAQDYKNAQEVAIIQIGHNLLKVESQIYLDLRKLKNLSVSSDDKNLISY
ncbi:MAG: hypothetical protein ACNS62_04335 [Candidatus Cyclobacteriaceae bacterium M3_2C_046]